MLCSIPPKGNRRLQKMATSKKINGRSIAEINQKIKSGDVQVLTAEEMKKLVESCYPISIRE